MFKTFLIITMFLISCGNGVKLLSSDSNPDSGQTPVDNDPIPVDADYVYFNISGSTLDVSGNNDFAAFYPPLAGTCAGICFATHEAGINGVGDTIVLGLYQDYNFTGAQLVLPCNTNLGDSFCVSCADAGFAASQKLTVDWVLNSGGCNPVPLGDFTVTLKSKQ
jgi:hypothetical protein